MQNIKVLLVDDHEIVNLGVKTLISKTPGLILVGIAVDGDEAIEKAVTLLPDVIILDINLPKRSGIEVAKELSKKKLGCKIILFTSFIDEQYIIKGFEVGAFGYVPKNFNPDHLIEAIHTVYEGKYYMKEFISEIFINNYLEKENNPTAAKKKTDLTKREMQILQLVCQGNSNHDIARDLFLSNRTIETHKANIMKKLKINNIAELIVYAIRHGLAHV